MEGARFGNSDVRYQVKLSCLSFRRTKEAAEREQLEKRITCEQVRAAPAGAAFFITDESIFIARLHFQLKIQGLMSELSELKSQLARQEVRIYYRLHPRNLLYADGKKCFHRKRIKLRKSSWKTKKHHKSKQKNWTPRRKCRTIRAKGNGEGRKEGRQ